MFSLFLSFFLREGGRERRREREAKVFVVSLPCFPVFSFAFSWFGGELFVPSRRSFVDESVCAFVSAFVRSFMDSRRSRDVAVD